MPPEKIYKIYWKHYGGNEGTFLVSAYDKDAAYSKAIQKLKEDNQLWHIMEAEETSQKYIVRFEKPEIVL